MPSVPHAVHGLWHVQRVKRLVRAGMGQGVQCMVSVREAICADPACPGPATEIRIVMLDFRELRATVHKAVADVTEQDVSDMFATLPR